MDCVLSTVTNNLLTYLSTPTVLILLGVYSKSLVDTGPELGSG